MDSDNDHKIIPILKYLREHGWIPLRSMAALLGYAHVVQIYQRQKTKHKIPVLRVGGVNRVYEDTVLAELSNARYKPADALMYLEMYGTIKRSGDSI